MVVEGKVVPEGVVGGANGKSQCEFLSKFVVNVNWFSSSCLSVSAANIQNVRIPMIEIKEQYLSREKY